jgi:hypothetical protein
MSSGSVSPKLTGVDRYVPALFCSVVWFSSSPVAGTAPTVSDRRNPEHVFHLSVENHVWESADECKSQVCIFIALTRQWILIDAIYCSPHLLQKVHSQAFAFLFVPTHRGI